MKQHKLNNNGVCIKCGTTQTELEKRPIPCVSRWYTKTIMFGLRYGTRLASRDTGMGDQVSAED